MGTGLREAAEGYVELAQWWIDTWGTHVTKIAAKVDAGGYTADDGVADLSECASLAAESLVLLVNEAFDAAKILTGEQDAPHMVDTLDFPAPVRSATNPGLDRPLQLTGPLVAAVGTDQIPASKVTFIPAALGPNDTAFKLRVDATGHDGVTYFSHVRVLDGATGATLETVQVWVSVP